MTNRFKGISYPLIKHPEGFFHHGSDIDLIKSSMAAVILTEPQERIFEPTFGVNLSKINTNSPSELVEGDFRVRIASVLKRWEKRVQVVDIKVKIEKLNEQMIARIQVLFIDPIDIRKTHELSIVKALGDINGRSLPF